MSYVIRNGVNLLKIVIVKLYVMDNLVDSILVGNSFVNVVRIGFV